jgi:hypothetical protein
MSDNHGALDPDLLEGITEQLSLLGGRPHLTAPALAVAKARPIKDDHPMAAQQYLRNPAGVPIIAVYGIAVYEDNRAAAATITVVQPYAVDLYERTRRRVPALRAASCEMVGDSEGDKDSRPCDGGPAAGGARLRI